MLDLKHLKTIKALQETGSLTRAADQLHVTQSALSHQIRDLEDWFGVQLFIRKSRPLRLTPAGERLLATASAVLPELVSAEQALLALGRGQRGRLHMAIECHSCYLWLIPAVNSYRPAWPDVELDFVGHWHLDALPALARGELDLVVTADPVPMEGVTYEPLFRFEILLAMAPSHPLARNTRVAADDLAGETLITYPVDPERLDVFRHFLWPAGLEPAHVRTADMTMMIVQLVASQRGVAALPSWALREYMDSGLLAARPLGAEGVWSDLYAAVRVDDRKSPYMDAFLDTVRKTSFNTLSGIRRQQS
ncbi:MAG: LysR family transcriptional regulator [Marinobacter sp.]|uniref:LysR family transcriptional regulator n=1 Tax=Marinobacter sp. TaxID=50741 RepID=UPI00299DE07F|nr:LysR family transcriptional regulator [Marinobacter sp.]MDX1757589.1 LysR family transcriptional regulator [Marinobacter sp.]